MRKKWKATVVDLEWVGGMAKAAYPKSRTPVTMFMTTVSTTYPSYNNLPPGHLMYIAPIAHQVGRVQSNTMAKVQWKGKEVEFMLESTLINQITRDVDANHYNSGWHK
jgi:hypothetical protein